MVSPLALLAIAAAGAVSVQPVSVQPASVPARGGQQVLLTVDRTAMVHLSAKSRGGTRCELVDQLQGPFLESGAAGRSSCDVDVLLDPGPYLLRLESPRKGKGQVAIAAAAFTELNAPLLRLAPGRRLERPLHPRGQASYWIHLEKRAFVPLQIWGRTAGAVRLWRNGEWAEPSQPRAEVVSPMPNQPIYRWQYGDFLEAGDYLVTVYGAAPKAWAEGAPDDAMAIAYGFSEASPDGQWQVTLPFTGEAAFALPTPAPVVHARLPTAASTPTAVSLAPVAPDGSIQLSREIASCRIEARATAPECAANGSSARPPILLVRGAPGTVVELGWATWLGGSSRGVAEAYSAARQAIDFTAPRGGNFLVASDDLPPDQDAAPLGCRLEREARPGTWTTLAISAPKLSSDHRYERRFNDDGSAQTFWFELEQGGRWLISDDPERKATCELWRISDDRRERVSEDSNACKIDRSLSAGVYELKLYGGTEGIQTLRLTPNGFLSRPTNAPLSQFACRFDRAGLEKGTRYRVVFNRVGRAAARGLFFRPLPLELDRPLPLELAPGGSLKVPVQAGPGLVAKALGAGDFECGVSGAPRAPAQGGLCRFPPTAQSITLANRGAEPLRIRLGFERPRPPEPPLEAFSPKFDPLPALAVDAPVFFDFERGASHSALFEVRRAGLYDVSTEGLLQTSCAIRTPATPELAENQGAGRGRNCRVSAWLRPGRYLATATTLNASKGRGALALSAREPKVQSVSAGLTYFRVEAGDLVQQRMRLLGGGESRLETLVRGAALSCRLEDKDGWPVVRVPSPCDLTLRLTSGDYLWTQLPLTVESDRRTRFEKVRARPVLKGKKPRSIALGERYRAELSPAGKDQYLFELPADLDLRVELTAGMQGRLYRLEEGKPPAPVDIIAPQESAPPAAEAPEEPEATAESMAEGAPPDEGGEEVPPEEAPVAPAAPRPAPAASPSAGAQRLSLRAGRYQLIAEHSRGDVSISYSLAIEADQLAPGLARDYPIPGDVEVRLGSAGLLRLRTDGELDPRCRLYDGRGRLVAASSGRGADWNCEFSEPLPAGNYRLAIESETLQSGTTRVSAAMSASVDAAAPEVGKAVGLAVGSGSAQVSLPAPGASVQEIRLRSKAPFSSALALASGISAERCIDRTECSFLLAPSTAGSKLLVWRAGASSEKVDLGLATRAVAERGPGRIAQTEVVKAQVPKAGLYRTGQGVLCLPAGSQGVFASCGPEISLEQGPTLFASLGNGKLSPHEIVAKVGESATERVRLAGAPFIQAQRSSGRALHLLRVTGRSGMRAAPGCALVPGARALGDEACFGASVQEEAVARWWTAGEPGEADVQRQAVKLPSSARPLAPGQQGLEWSEPAARFSLPAGPSRVELTLAPETWAVLLDGAGEPVDLCAPSVKLGRCLFLARGGEVVLAGAGERRAEASLFTGAPAARAALSDGLFEAVLPLPGATAIAIAADPRERALEVTGARACLLRLADGRRASSCTARLPANASGEVVAESTGGPLRAVAYAGALGPALFPRLPPAGKPSPLAEGQAASLAPGFDRAIALEQSAVVHVRATAGVCALVSADGAREVAGDGRGCELHRLLEKGTHRLLIRPFGDQPLQGVATWTRGALEALGEGIGPERWIAPGEARYFRFTTASKGRVGIGLQAQADTLDCTVLDASQKALGDGCQQLLELEQGSYLFAVRAPPASPASRIRPVVFGLAGAKLSVPEEYLRDFFARIGAQP
jgi:hypothetical protein